MIKNIDLAYIIPIALSLISFVGIFLYGKRQVDKKSQVRVLRFIPMLSVVALILGVFYITSYYQKQLTIEKEKFLLLQKQNYYNDSILLSTETKNLALDSLKILNEKLIKLLANINKQEKITGDDANIKEKIKEKITKTNQEIGEIESYNEIVEKPKYISKGYSYNGNTSNFTFYCPNDKTSEFIDLKLQFPDKTLINKIDIIYVEAVEVRDDGKNYLVFGQAYKAQEGVNAFKIRNYLKNKKTTLLIGYFLKSEATKETPSFEKVSCSSE